MTEKSCRALRVVAKKMQGLLFLSYNWNTGDQMHSIRACLMYYFIKWNLLKYLFKLTFIGFCENSQFIIPLYYPNCTRVQSFFFLLFCPDYIFVSHFLLRSRGKSQLQSPIPVLCSYAVVSDMASIQTRPQGFCLRNGDEVGYHIIV